jgi:hypothetical protein
MPRFEQRLVRVVDNAAMHAKISRMPDSFTAVIGLWPTVEAMAIDLHTHSQVVRQWKARNSIPSPFWATILETRVARRERLTATLFVQLADRRRRLPGG